MIILAIRTDKPEAELYLFDVEDPNSREEQPEQKSHFLPGAMRNPEGVSYRPEATIKWEAHRQLAETIHKKIRDLLQERTLEEVKGIVVFKGPGSFTGLRIGISVSNAFVYSLEVPIASTSGEGWLEQGIKKIKMGQNEKIALPEYGQLPHTTQPKK